MERPRPPEVRAWFLSEVLVRLGEGSHILELGCGPGIDAAELSTGRRYVGVDLSWVQLSIARRHVPHATFVQGDFTSMAFRPGLFDGVVAFYIFMTSRRRSSRRRTNGPSRGCVPVVG